jgi:hypothetical protein
MLPSQHRSILTQTMSLKATELGAGRMTRTRKDKIKELKKKTG